jgi:large conductance mechanosensitive channel
VNFLLVAWVLFLLVKAYNRITGPKGEPAATKSCEFCRTPIPVDAVRCPNCTSDLMAPSASPPP